MISGGGLGPWPLWATQGLISELSWAAGRDQSDHCGQLFLSPKSLLGAAGDVATDSGASVTPPSSGQWLHPGLHGIRNKLGGECPGEAPGASLLDFSVCHFPMANAAPKSVCGPLNCQFLGRLEDLAPEARSHHSAESVQGIQVEVSWRQARPISQPPAPLCCRQEALEPAVIFEDSLASGRFQTFREQFLQELEERP